MYRGWDGKQENGYIDERVANNDEILGILGIDLSNLWNDQRGQKEHKH